MTSSEPTLCSNGCGFFSTAATKGLCSKCYKDYTKSITPTPSPTPIVPVSINHQANSNKDSTNDRAFPHCVSTNDRVFPHCVSTNDRAKEPAAKVYVAKKIRCEMCNKKLGLTGFYCRCGNMFCGSHRYAEAHGCNFDFKAKGRIELLKENPVVRVDKLQRF